MNNDQLNSLVRSTLKLVGAALMAHGATKAAAVVSFGPFVEAACGLASAILGLWLSHGAHAGGAVATKTTTTAQNENAQSTPVVGGGPRS